MTAVHTVVYVYIVDVFREFSTFFSNEDFLIMAQY
jgi:hypothetical protein